MIRVKDLETVLKSYEIHSSKNDDCRYCSYRELDLRNCINEMEKDLYENLKALKEENENLKEHIRKEVLEND